MKTGLGRHLRHRLGVSFGRVHTATRCISAGVILDRRLAGETVAAIADDYGIAVAEVKAVEAWVGRLIAAEEARLREKAEAQKRRTG